MTIRRGAAPKRDFTILPNQTINDTRFSFRSLGLLTFLLSKPENWTVDASALSMGESREGRDAIRKALNEIEAAGYLVREKKRGDGGRFTTESVIYDLPMGANAQVGPATDFQARVTSDGKPGPNRKRTNKRTELADSQFSISTAKFPEEVHQCELCVSGWVEDPDSTFVDRCPNADSPTLRALP